MSATDQASKWYTTDFIFQGLQSFLQEQGFRVTEPDEEKPTFLDKVVIASRLLTKEVIEIRGTLSGEAHLPDTEAHKRARMFSEAMHWLSDALLSPITFFTTHYGDNRNRCLCLPDVEHYREILDKVKDYFTTNNLYLKVYLVSEDASVHIHQLNERSNKKVEKDQEVEGL
jgi:hypothetical protein